MGSPLLIIRCVRPPSDHSQCVSREKFDSTFTPYSRVATVGRRPRQAAACFFGNLSAGCATELSEGLVWVLHIEPNDVNGGYAEYTSAPAPAWGLATNLASIRAITSGTYDFDILPDVFSLELFGYFVPPVTGLYTFGQSSGAWWRSDAAVVSSSASSTLLRCTQC